MRRRPVRNLLYGRAESDASCHSRTAAPTGVWSGHVGQGRPCNWDGRQGNRQYRRRGFNPTVGNYGSSFVAASLRDLHLLDYYTPLNWRLINRDDLDMCSGGYVWFAYKNYNLIAGGGKEAVVYLLNADSLGGKDHHTPLFVTPPLGNDVKALE